MLRVFLFLSSVAVFGSLLYYTLPVTRLGLLAVVVLAAVVALAFRAPGRSPTEAEATGGQTTVRATLEALTKVSPARERGVAMQANAEASPRSHRAFYPLAIIVILALGAWWSAVLPIEITDAVRSPWGLVPTFAVVALGLAFFALLTLLTRPPSRLTTALFVAALFSSAAMAAVVYALGFGFDPFLHRATMAHIAEFGTITPKPLYYIGQYALELVPHLLLGLPLSVIDRYLLPLLGAVMLTTSAMLGLVPLARGKHAFALAGLLLFPLGTLISTTPQGIAYVFCASAVLLTLGRLHDVRFPLTPSIALAVAALFTHPFAGIPAVMYVGAFWLTTKFSTLRARRVLLTLSTMAALIAIPAVFALQAVQSGLQLSFQLGNLFDANRWSELALTGFFANHFSFAYDLLYLVLDNLLVITAVFAAVGLVSLLRRHSADVPLILLPFLFALAMFVNFLTLSLLFDFDFLISYERSDYALRSLTMAHIFLLPLAAVGLTAILERLAQKPLALRTGFIALIALIGMGNVYGAYPRHDNYARSAGFNVSRADFDAVDAIDDHADGEDYIVLANQATSAAAVEANGFKKYYHGDIFYYPIPTGGIMYEYFLTMVNDAPTVATIRAAMDVAGVDLGYFAVSDYWWQSDVIIENTKRLADDWFAIGDGSITVFIFRQ